MTDPSHQLCAGVGMAIGTVLNFNPKGSAKASAKMGTTVTKALTHVLEREAIESSLDLCKKITD